MKLKIRYSTLKKKFVSSSAFSYVMKEVELEPTSIIRHPCGSGAASKRFTYQAKFLAPSDAAFQYDGYIIENINRKTNPHFKPKDFSFTKNVCQL